MNFTETQKQRLIELNAPTEIIGLDFASDYERNKVYKEASSNLVKAAKSDLKEILTNKLRPELLVVEENITQYLLEGENFTKVITPTIISKEALKKMTIDEEHKLLEQVFALDKNKYLRPMLAPNLYQVMRDIHKIEKKPVRIFEAGSCFRKDSESSEHLTEFTMLNLVELDSVAEGEQMDRLKELAIGVMDSVGITDFEMLEESSSVYGETLDIVIDGMEIASGAFGPHPLDGNWGVFEPWVGIGFGLERIAMITGGYSNIKSVAKSLSFLDGVPLRL
ncbi:MAG: pyrrolysine--tRNA(Pyl) ligase large subunit [Anaerovoracaceae bacterium]